MVPGNNKNLPIVFRCPFPEIPQRSHSVFQIENVSGQYEYIARYRKSVLFYVPAVLPELKNADRSYIVFSYYLFLFACSTCFWIILFTSSNETGVKSLLSTPTSYCVGKSISSREASFPVLFLLVCTCPNSCHIFL